jgi:superfamily I DNA/RNA helicase
MDKITSADDLTIYSDDKNIRILAGPGAGKTHLLIKNIKHIVEKSNRLKNNNKRKILCITYTNAAVEEIVKRLGSYSKYVVVSTIHAFINEYIILPFQLQIRIFIMEKFNIIVPDDIKISSVQEGFSVLSGHKKEDVYTFIHEKYPDIPAESYNAISRTKMCDVMVDISEINKYPYNVSADVKIATPKNVSCDVAKAIKEYIWGIAGKLAFDEILYFGLQLIEKYPSILYILRAEFPYILMDEYQDTNPIQNRILDMMSEKEASVIVVGDIAQSIYSFQGATYQEFLYFNLKSAKPIITKAIEGNRRSTQNIINLLNFIRKDDTTGFEQKCIKNTLTNNKVIFLIQENKSLIRPLSKLIPHDTKILCRKWSEAFNYIDGVSGDQKTLINDIYNAYTYAAHRDMAQEIETKREAWICSALDIAELGNNFINKDIPKALKILNKYLEISDIFKNFDKDKLQKLQSIINTWESIFSTKDLDSKLLKDIVTIINQKFCNIENITVLENFKYPESTDTENYFEPIYKHVDKLTYGCAKKIVLELFSEDSKHMTIHQAKGKEFNNVLLNLEPFARVPEKSFNPKDIFITPTIINNATNPAFEEYTRVAYVGCSHAINKLYIHLHGDKQMAEAIANSLNNYYKGTPEKQNFFDFIYC